MKINIVLLNLLIISSSLYPMLRKTGPESRFRNFAMIKKNNFQTSFKQESIETNKPEPALSLNDQMQLKYPHAAHVLQYMERTLPNNGTYSEKELAKQANKYAKDIYLTKSAPKNVQDKIITIVLGTKKLEESRFQLRTLPTELGAFHLADSNALAKRELPSGVTFPNSVYFSIDGKGHDGIKKLLNHFDKTRDPIVLTTKDLLKIKNHVPYTVKANFCTDATPLFALRVRTPEEQAKYIENQGLAWGAVAFGGTWIAACALGTRDTAEKAIIDTMVDNIEPLKETFIAGSTQDLEGKLAQIYDESVANIKNPWSEQHRVDSFAPDWFEDWKNTQQALIKVGEEVATTSALDGIKTVQPLATQLIMNALLSPQTFSTIATNPQALAWGATAGSLAYMAGTFYGAATAKKPIEQKKIADIV